MTAMNRPERKTSRGQRDQLLTLINGWDPAGLLAAGASRDAYEGIVDDLLNVLAGRATAGELAAFLDTEIEARFGAPPVDSMRFATKTVSWFEMSESESER